MRKQQIPRAARKQTPPATPTPMPILALEDRPEDDAELDEEEAAVSLDVALVATLEEAVLAAELNASDDVSAGLAAGGVDSV